MTHASIPFQIRESARAKRTRLILRPEFVEIVIPAGTNHARAIRFFEDNIDWVRHTYLKTFGKIPQPPHDAFDDLPLFNNIAEKQKNIPIDTFELRAVGRTLHINYVAVPILPSRIRLTSHSATPDALTVYCADPAHPPRVALTDALRARIRAEAKQHLPDLLRLCARDTDITAPRHIRIGFQRTVWGSRSSSGTISLSASLMFLPPALVRHILLHELCHTVHMNHGAAFKTLLRRCDADYDAHVALLKTAAKLIPEWMAATE